MYTVWTFYRKKTCITFGHEKAPFRGLAPTTWVSQPVLARWMNLVFSASVARSLFVGFSVWLFAPGESYYTALSCFGFIGSA